MKASRLLGISIPFLLIIGGVLLSVSGVAINRGLKEPGDLRFRYNESCCAHSRVNPFRVWNGEVVTADFKGMDRPDKLFDPDPKKKIVHAYPPWHMGFTWFYAWLPFPFIVGLIYFGSGLALFAVVSRMNKEAPRQNSVLFWAATVALLLPPAISCLTWGQYGLMIAGLTVLFFWAEERKLQAVQGIAWALMMIKPQVAALMLFPLLFRRRYLSIVVASVVCGFSTLAVSFWYGESPVNLVLQILEIGKPYDTSTIFTRLMPSYKMGVVKNIWMAVAITLCAMLSWRLRRSRPLLAYSPVALVFPVWTYSQEHDAIASWPIVAVLLYVLLEWCTDSGVKKRTISFILLSVIGLASVFSGIWEICVAYDYFSPTGIGWIYSAVNFPVKAAMFGLGIYVLWKAADIESINA